MAEGYCEIAFRLFLGPGGRVEPGVRSLHELEE